MTARRDARRRRAGAYKATDAAAASRQANRKSARGRGGGTTKKNKVILDVDLDADKPDESEKYQVQLAGVKRLNTAKRDIERQTRFQDTMESEGWYMVEVPETREEQAAKAITAVSGSAEAGGVVIDAWVPRVPPRDYVVSESEAEGLTEIQLLQGVPVEGAEKPFGGYILLHMSVNQTLLECLDGIYQFKGFAVSGITKYGSTRKQTGEKPRQVAPAQLEMMKRTCAVTVLSDDEAKSIRAAAKRRAEVAEREAAMGEVEPMSEEDLAAFRAKTGVGGGGTGEEEEERGGEGGGGAGSENGNGAETSTAPKRGEVPAGATALEVHSGPFKGFKGYTTGENEDGTVDAQLTIFGRETAVTLEAHEYTKL